MSQNFNLKNIKLLIGLGNPGNQYKNTYHNVGFLFIDYANKNCPLFTIHCPLLKTESFFMNASGPAVAKLIKKNGVKPAQIVIVHDDADLTLGQFKIQFNRNPAGHKGVASIIRSLGTKEFWRLRLGIRPLNNKSKAEKFVLKKITVTDKKTLEKTFNLLIDHLTPQPSTLNPNF